MTDNNRSLFLEWYDAIGASYSSVDELWHQFLLGKPSSLDKPWLALSPKIESALECEASCSRYYSQLDKLGRMWLCLGKRVQQYQKKQLEIKRVYIHGASARAHDDAYLRSGLEESSKVLTSPMTTPSGALNCVAKDLNSPFMTKLVSATCVSLASALEDYLVHRDTSSDVGFLLLSGECVSSPYKIKMYQNLGVYHSGGEPFFNKSYAVDRTGMLLADGSSGFLFKQKASKNSILEVLDVNLQRDSASTLTGVASSEFISKSISEALSKNQVKPHDIDFIVGHGSATQKGDDSEMKAYQKAFGESVPSLLSTKWLTGHLLGGSMGASLALASKMVLMKTTPKMPYQLTLQTKKQTSFQKGIFLVVGLGFNGQVALILGRGIK